MHYGDGRALPSCAYTIYIYIYIFIYGPLLSYDSLLNNTIF